MCVYVYMSILYIVCLFDVVIKLPFSKTKKKICRPLAICQATSATIAAAGWLQRPRVADTPGR